VHCVAESNRLHSGRPPPPLVITLLVPWHHPRFSHSVLYLLELISFLLDFDPRIAVASCRRKWSVFLGNKFEAWVTFDLIFRQSKVTELVLLYIFSLQFFSTMIHECTHRSMCTAKCSAESNNYY
jgi:hypothetical protein